MDDDPEPNVDNGMLECGVKNEQMSNVEDFQKLSLDSPGETNSLDMNPHQESGDTGPFLEQEVLKKPTTGKVVPGPGPRVDSKDSLFRRPERVDPGQGTDTSGSVKSSGSSTPPRKPPRRSLQRLAGQDSRRSSQVSLGQQSLLSQKPSRTQPGIEPGIKDMTWVSQRTGKVMKCRSQQTSRTWERKMLSDVLCSSSEESERTDQTNTEEELTSLWETTETDEEVFRQQRPWGRPQLEGKLSRHSSQPLESHRSSQHSIQLSSLLGQKASQGQITKDMATSWMSQKTGRTMTCSTQQTSFVWEPKPLADVLYSSSQESQISREAETDGTDTEGTLASLGDRDPEQQKMELQSKRHILKTDQAQQTDSAGTLKKTLLDSSQQTDVFDDTNFITAVFFDTGTSYAPKSQHGSQERMEQESYFGSPKSISLDFQRGSQQSLKVMRISGENDPKLLTDPGGLQNPFAKDAPERRSIVAVVEDLWISQKTGKVVRDQGQQTDKSWLQYQAAKMLKVKKCSSQQTDESFLQRYSSHRMKKEKGGAPPSSAKAEQYRPSRPGSRASIVDPEDLKFVDLDASSLDGELARTARDQEYLTSEEEGGAELSQHAGNRNGFQLSSSPDQWPDEPNSQTAMGDTSSFIEGLDEFQQTYSIISLEDGIWMNRRTGRLLVSHSQQTSITSLPGSKAALGKWEEDAFKGPGTRTGSLVDVQQAKGQETRHNPGPDPESVRGNPVDQDRDSHLIMVQPLLEDSGLSEDMENLLSSRLSEAMLLSVDTPDIEQESQEIYNVISFHEGSFLNVKTGRLLSSQTQQTEEPFEQILRDCLQASSSTSPQPPEKGQEKITEPSSDAVEECVEEGMDDDSTSKKTDQQLPSQMLQTEEPVTQSLQEGLQASRATSQQPPKKDQAEIAEPSRDHVEECAEEGMDDDPISKKTDQQGSSHSLQPVKQISLEDVPASTVTSQQPPDQAETPEPSSDNVEECSEEGMDDDPIRKKSEKQVSTQTQPTEQPKKKSFLGGQQAARATSQQPPRKVQPKIAEPSSDHVEECSEEGMDDDPTSKIQPQSESSEDQ